jgi:predicted nucleic acid-binding protein
VLRRFLEFIAGDPEQARSAGRWRARARAAGRDIGIADALIAASAHAADSTVRTRNVRDFSMTPVAVATY